MSTLAPETTTAPDSSAVTPYWSLLTTILRGNITLAETETAHDGLVAACMKDRGWEYVPTVYQGDEEPASVEASIGYRKLHGYTNPSSSNPDPRRPPGGVVFGSKEEQAKFVSAYNGGASEEAAPSGCVGEANRSMANRVPMRDPELPARWYGPTIGKVLSDERVVAAYSEWRACLADRGIAVSTTALDAREAGSGTAIAVADAECYLSHIAPVFNRVELEYLPSFLSQYPQYADLVQSVLKASGYSLP